MCKAYDWAFVNPLRKIFYNITTTGLSIAVALVIGTIELLQVSRTMLDLRGPFFDFIGKLDFGALGYVIVGVFLMAWGTSFALWRFMNVEERHAVGAIAHVHEHRHESGASHTHEHLH
jgi:high-affinity nickel-transport protein